MSFSGVAGSKGAGRVDRIGSLLEIVHRGRDGGNAILQPGAQRGPSFRWEKRCITSGNSLEMTGGRREMTAAISALEIERCLCESLWG